MMKVSYWTIFFLFVTNNVLACTTCNKKLQQAIIENYFATTIISLAMILILLVGAVIIVNTLLHSNYSKHGAGYLNPAPLTTAALLLGIGMGGFMDGIIFHQVLQWHEMISNKLIPDTLINKSVNMFWDGIFHLSCLSFVIIGVHCLWKITGKREIDMSGKLLYGGLLAGWGIFNLIEGIIDHQLVHLHHVKESINYQSWNIGFLLFSLLLLISGFGLIRSILKPYKNKIVNA